MNLIGFTEVEIDRTKKLVGRISGKQNIDIRYRNITSAGMNSTGGFSMKKRKLDEDELDQNQQHPLPDYKGEFTVV